MDIIVVPAYRRPEMLCLTLEHLLRADGIRQHEIVFMLDNGFDRDVLEVIKLLCAEQRFNVIQQCSRVSTGNSFNVLDGLNEGLLLALQRKSKLVYLVEEDVLVARDFFHFHETVQRDYPGVVAAVRADGDRLIGAENLLVCSTRYRSLGVSFSLDILSHIVVHHTNLYHDDPRSYCQAVFPDSGITLNWVEQDGLINRVLERIGIKTLYPMEPRICHIGFYGYGARRGIPPDGATWQERTRQLRNMSVDEMNCRSSPGFRDIEKCNFDGYFTNRFEIAGNT